MTELKTEELNCGCIMGPDGFITAMCLNVRSNTWTSTDAWERARLEAAQ